MAKVTIAPSSDEMAMDNFLADFRAVEKRRADRQSVMTLLVAVTLTLLIVGIPGWLWYGWYHDARRQILLDEFDARRRQTETLPHRRNPFVAEQIEQADQIRIRAVHDPSSTSAAAGLHEGLERLTEAVDVDHALQRLSPLHKPLGTALNETPWHISSQNISGRLDKLRQRHIQTRERLDAGDTAAAEREMAALLADLGDLQRDNVKAMRTDSVRQAWTRLQNAAPERLRGDTAWNAVEALANQAESGWTSGHWDPANTLYAQAIEKGQLVFDDKLTPEERSPFTASQTESITRVEAEKDALRKETERLSAEQKNLATLLAKSNEEWTKLQEENKSLQKRLVATQAEASNVAVLQMELKQTKQELDGANKEMQTASKASNEMQTKLAAALAKVTEYEAKIAKLESLSPSSGSIERAATTTNAGAGLGSFTDEDFEIFDDTEPIAGNRLGKKDSLAFEGKDDTGKLWKSYQHLGKSALVVFFYPADFTGGSTKQASAYRDDLKQIKEAGAEVIGVSGDSPEAHQLFKKTYSLNFTLLADTDGAIAKAFGVPTQEGKTGTKASVDGTERNFERSVTTQRATFVIDRKGNIVHRNTRVSASGDSDAILTVLKSLSQK